MNGNGTPAKDIMEILIRCKVIPPDYVGEVVLHVGQGSLCDVENRTKGLKKLLDIYPKEEKPKIYEINIKGGT